MRNLLCSLAWFCLAGWLALGPANAQEPSQTPAKFACEIRYQFREKIPDAKPGEKQFSAPSHERETLPISKPVALKGVTAQEVAGQVKSLPYKFLIRVTRSANASKETLKVNVLDESGRPLAGFPKVIPNPLTRTGDSSRTDFEIPISEPLKKKIEKSLLAQDQFLTTVSLIVGMDDDFLSSAAGR